MRTHQRRRRTRNNPSLHLRRIMPTLGGVSSIAPMEPSLQPHLATIGATVFIVAAPRSFTSGRLLCRGIRAGNTFGKSLDAVT